jgi:hypothetical protein
MKVYDERLEICMHYGNISPAFWPILYVIPEGQRIRCPICQMTVTDKNLHRAFRRWNRLVKAKPKGGDVHDGPVFGAYDHGR